MTWLSPMAWVWLGSVPVLVWLWRHAASRQQVAIPSLVPFEHLLRRAPQRRTRLLVNLLFWLQLACLLLTVLALAQPVLLGRRARTTLVIVDTSASMNASLGGATPLQQARAWLLSRLATKPPRERWFVMASAPVAALTPQSVSDAFELRRVLVDLSASDVAGNLAMAARISRGLAGESFDAVLVATDESPPADAGSGVELRSFGKPLPNVALAGIDASVPLCVSAASSAHLLVLVHNFSDAAQTATLTVRRDGRILARRDLSLAPSARASVPLDLPSAEAGRYEVRLAAPRDALAVDDHAVIDWAPSARLPVAIASNDASFADTIGRWLEACPRVAWRRAAASATPAEPSELLVTDDPEAAGRWPGGSVTFMARPASPRLRRGLSEARSAEEGRAPPRVRLTHWLVDPTHPLGAYLEPVETVAASLTVPAADPSGDATETAWGHAVFWGLVDGRRVPIVLVEERGGARHVMMRVDPAATPDSVPMLLAFLNSLRWLSGTSAAVATGQPLLAGPFERGAVRIRRPDGVEVTRESEGDVCRYEATDRAGRYRFLQGATIVDRFVNFLDAVESNTMRRASTWDRAAVAAGGTDGARPSREPLEGWLIGAFLLVWLVEWWRYSRRRS